MEGNNCKPSAASEKFKCTVKTSFKNSEFIVYRNSQSLKAFSRRMSVTADTLWNIFFYNFRKLKGSFNRLFGSCLYDSVYNCTGKFFFAVNAEDSS